ncbi:MAG: hypothetical protein K2X63_04050 [Burkholderiaceae bacterium]|jgi:hypothetical protein|nr:hypothetical protein [Burkholderiaceae bacterium]
MASIALLAGTISLHSDVIYRSTKSNISLASLYFILGMTPIAIKFGVARDSQKSKMAQVAQLNLS